MAALSLVAGALALAGAPPPPAAAVARWRPLIADASLRFGIPERWIERVMRAESGGRTTLYGLPIRSQAGAIGLMQLMPPTWDAMRLRFHLGANPDDPHDNIVAGSGYLRLLYDRFGYPGLFAAYNAGPARYAAHLASGRTLPIETLAYLGKVGDLQSDRAEPPVKTAHNSLFAIKPDGGSDTKNLATTTVEDLFAVKK
jgi:soluble lytic murein transglycosylase-like protein